VDRRRDLEHGAARDADADGIRVGRIAAPTLPWEIQGFKVNEGPAVIIRNGRGSNHFAAAGRLPQMREPDHAYKGASRRRSDGLIERTRAVRQSA
jgi:hypothetical protein